MRGRGKILIDEGFLRHLLDLDLNDMEIRSVEVTSQDPITVAVTVEGEDLPPHQPGQESEILNSGYRYYDPMRPDGRKTPYLKHTPVSKDLLKSTDEDRPPPVIQATTMP